MNIKKDSQHKHEDIHDHNRDVTHETGSYWRRMLRSTHKAMTIGAQSINRMMSWARGSNCRRRDKK